MNAGPHRNDRLDYKLIRAAIDGLHFNNPLSIVVIAGGEPTAYRDVLRRSISYCAENGIRSRLVTNAFWAKDPHAAHALLSELKKAGLDELNISADDFHLPFVPIGHVTNAWRAGRELEYSSVIIANSSGPESIVNPGYIIEMLGEDDVPIRSSRDGAESVTEFLESGKTYSAIYHTPLQRLERAGDRLPENSFVSVTDLAHFRGRCPHAIRHAALSPRGHLLACCGFELDGNDVLDLGSLELRDAWELVIAANRNDILAGIAYLGPCYLRGIVEKVVPGTCSPGSAGSVCEICRSVVANPKAVRILREASPLWLPALAEARRIVNGRAA